MSSINHDDFAHLRIPLESILSATNYFSDKNLVGENASEKDYYGKLLRSGESIKIIVRRLNKEWFDGDQQFWMEVSILSCLKHKNLVSFVGFCDDKDENVIIYKSETRGSVKWHLSDPMLLTWVRRLEISIGIAQALSYIHYDESRDFSVIHRNIDSSSIKLNDVWEPKLGDFIYSMKIKASERHNSFYTDKVWSRDGYTDPTYIETKSLNHKSDIYSFGIVMFELLCGRKAVIEDDGQDNKYLASVAVTHYREKKLNEMIDWDLWSQMDSQSFNIFAEIAYDCLNEERSERPNIDEIVMKLEKALEEHHNATSSLKDDLAHLKIPLEKIRSATNNFAYKSNKGKRKTYCEEYKGQLSWFNDLIVIYARRLGKLGRQKEREFWMEVSLLSSLKHKNLVSFVGFCDENDEKIIITRCETRGWLGQYLSNPMMLTWVRRLEISVGIAQALSYIHYDESHDFNVIHTNISSYTVQLNDDWEPKLSNFEYSMKIQASQRHHSFHTNKLKYGDPTYIKAKSVNHKSDIYSFGIVLIQLLCGKESEYNNSLVAPFITHYREKKLDNLINPTLWNQMDLHSFNMFAEIAYECLDKERSRHPNINDIVPRFEKALELAHDNRLIHSSPNHLTHLGIPMDDLLFATKGSLFYYGEKGGIGKIYNGQLSSGGELINITIQRLINKEWNEKEQQFWTEISMLSSLKHKNLIYVAGFCNEVGSETIIYNDVSRGRLVKYLSYPKLLTWVKRLEVSVGVAHALSYIHYDEPRDFSVIHRNISSEAIQLNNDWEPKLSEFQHSMKIKASERHHSFHTDSVWSMKGHTDPTYLETGSVNHKSDIYSFGMVLFELLCGRQSVIDDEDNKYLAPVAIFHYREKILDEIIDPDLLKQIDPQSLNVFVKTAYGCLNDERSKRPSINKIVRRLEKAFELQLACKNTGHSLVAAEVKGTSTNHDKGSVTFVSTGVKSHLSKKPVSSLKDLSHLRLSFEDIASATNNFADENRVKESDIVLHHTGCLLHSGQYIDIVAKSLYCEDGKYESKKFWTEISMLSSLKHMNLVSIIGFCDEAEKKMIIYKKEANKSLRKYLSDQTLTWMQRLKICVGVANALSYIHYDAGRDFSVIHCNVRSSEILINSEWEPKLSGFELALKNTVTRRHSLLLSRDIVMNAYLDPKYKKIGGLTHKSDVYSFGVVLFEVLCGRSAVDEDEDEDNDVDDEDEDDNDDVDDDDENELGEGLLSQLAKSHLDDMIDPRLRIQMDQKHSKSSQRQHIGA